MKTIPMHRLPSFWRGMSFHGRAAWLCTAKIARDYNEACSLLAQLPRKKKPAPRQPAPDCWYLKD